MADIEYTVIPFKFNKRSEVVQQFFVKKHKVRNMTADRPAELTLFVCNVPPYVTKESLKRVFSPCGTITNIYFASAKTPSIIFPEQSSKYFQVREPKEYKVAYVVFSLPSELQKALSWKTEKPSILSTKQCPIKIGYKKYIADCEDQYVKNVAEFKREINERIKEYDDQVKQKEKLEKIRAEKDEEGWVTVTKSGRRPGFSRRLNTLQYVGNETIQNETKKEIGKRKRDFYKFQIRESKMKRLLDIKQRFDQDKLKLEALKSKRSFKP